MTLEAATTHPRYLLIKEKPDPGWRSTVNGVSVPVHPLTSAMNVLRLNSMDDRVRVGLYYRPRLPFAIAGICWGGLALTGLALLVRRRQSRKKSVESGA